MSSGDRCIRITRGSWEEAEPKAQPDKKLGTGMRSREVKKERPLEITVIAKENSSVGGHLLLVTCTHCEGKKMNCQGSYFLEE